MKKIIDSIASLIRVKTIVTLIVLFVFAALSVGGKISPDNVMIVTTSVVSFYFGTQHEKKEGER